MKDLITADYVVTAISRNEEQLQALRALENEKTLELAACDLADTEATSNLTEKFDDVDALVHVATPPPANEHDHHSCTDQVIMSINLIALFGEKIERAIIGSCTGVCGDGGKESVTKETPNFPITYHGSSLQATEKLWNLYAVDSGKPVTFVRFAPSMIGKGKGMKRETGGENGTSGIKEISRMVLGALETREGGLITLY